jgi:hypothetical protein
MTFHFRLLRREVYDLVGGIDTSFQSAEDYDLCLKISEVKEIHHLTESLYYYREHPNSISQSSLQQQTESSGKAVTNALVRRGLADRYQLQISPTGQFKIQKRTAIDTPLDAALPVPPSIDTDARSLEMVYLAPQTNRGVRRGKGSTDRGSNPSRRVIYCATSHFLYLEAAIISALTLRKFEPNLPITIVSDCSSLQSLIPDRYQIDTKFIRPPTNWKSSPALFSRSIKTDIWQFTTATETLFLDADILPLQPLTPIWQYLEQGDLAMVLDRQPTIAGCNHINQTERDYTMSLYPSTTPHFNSGVMLWRKGANTQSLFKAWKREWLQFQQQDQLALVRAIQTTKSEIVRLPQSYNFSLVDLTQKLAHRDPKLYLLHCWGDIVMKGHFQQIAQQIDPNITEVVSSILTPIFTRVSPASLSTNLSPRS